MLNNPVEYALMAAAEKRHWWYVALHSRVFSAIEKQFGANKDIAILDAGCGTGGLWLKLKAAGYTNISGAELADTAIAICEGRNLLPVQTNIKNIDTAFAGKIFDVIICNDVLCYFNLRNAEDVVRKLTSLLKPGGILITNNPAHKAFAGDHDIAVGIQTRFQPTELKGIIMNYELSIVNSTQWPFILSPLIWWVRNTQRIAKKGKQYIVKSDVSFPPKGNAFLLAVSKLEMKLFNRAPWGSSVFIVARKG